MIYVSPLVEANSEEMAAKWRECKSHSVAIYETNRSVFVRCQKGHFARIRRDQYADTKTNYVFMINKTDPEADYWLKQLHRNLREEDSEMGGTH